MAYALKDNWYENDYYEQEECSTCNKLETKIEDIKDFMKGAIDQIYGQEEYDEHTLEFYLEEICNKLNIKFPKTNIQIQKKD